MSHDVSDELSQNAEEAELLSQAPDILIEVGHDGRLLYVSEAVERVVGHKPEFFVGRSFLEILVPEDRAATLDLFQKILNTRIEPLIPFRLVRSDGTRIALEATVRTFESVSGRRRMVGVVRDVTQQSAVTALESKRASHHRAIIESSLRPAAIVSMTGEIVFANRLFKSSIGTDIVLDDIYARMSGEVRQNMEAAWFDSTREDRDGRGACDFDLDEGNGTRRWFAATWEAFTDEEGQRLIAVLYEDISHRKHVEFALQSIAEGIANEGSDTVRRSLERVAQALDMDRLVLGALDPDNPKRLRVIHAWQDGAFLDIAHVDIHAVPDSTVARGESCIHPAKLAELIPQVADQIGHDIESYAGVPLRQPDGTQIGLIGGYSRHPIADPQLARSLLSTFAAHASAAVDRKQANEEVRANRDRFEVLAHQTHEMLVEVAYSGEISYVSKASSPLLGYSTNEMLGRHFQTLVHPDDTEKIRQSHRALVAGAEQSFVSLRAQHADGSWRWFEVRTSAFDASDGSKRALILARDVTEQRQTQLTQDLLYRVIQQSADLVLVCEPDTTLVFANDAAEQHLSPSCPPDPHANPTESEAPSQGRRVDEFLDAESAERLRIEIIPDLTPQSVWSGELQLHERGDGVSTPTEARVQLIAGSDARQRTHIAVTLQDIGARRTAEEALRHSEFQLNQAQKMEAVGRLAGGIAHDFNNLLTAIIGYSDLVLDGIGEGHGARRDVEEILRAAESAGGLTRQLLAFSRRQVLQPEIIDLNAVVADVDRMMRRLIGENIELVTFQDGELSLIVADPGQIEQVMVNLIVNARDAMPDGGRVEIETANLDLECERQTASGILPPGRYATLAVRDTGIGMSEEILSQIFEPFFTTKNAQQGTGLGLASVYGIVNQSEGQIDVESVLGEGTRFTTFFPVARAEFTPDDARHPPKQLSGRETILLVEDSGAVRRLVQRTLEKRGYRVLVAESATAALRHCSRHQGKIDLMLVDVVLPKMSGPEVARRAKELRPNLRLLFMSGFTHETLAQHGLEPSRVELLEKPFTPAAVLTRIRCLIDQDQAGDEDESETKTGSGPS